LTGEFGIDWIVVLVYVTPGLPVNAEEKGIRQKQLKFIKKMKCDAFYHRDTKRQTDLKQNNKKKRLLSSTTQASARQRV